jgi:hypothetical protein
MVDLEKEIELINEIDNWNEKIERIKEVKEIIQDERLHLENILEMIMKDEIPEVKKKKSKLTMDELVSAFQSAEKLDDKLKIYYLINHQINTIENQLFNNE